MNKGHSKRLRPVSTFIQIYELYAIGADSYSWHVLRRRRYKGGHQWISILWFATLEQCLHGFWQRTIQTSGAQSPTPRNY
jgi:hypothetical protein